MSPELISIGALMVMFLVAKLLPINIGILAFVAAFLIGTAALGLDNEQIFEGFPVSLFVTIVGVTYLFSIAQRNGTIDLLVAQGVRLVRGRVALIPWVLFVVAAVLTAFGTFTPAAVALLVPSGMSIAFRHGMSPLMMGICGATPHAGDAGGRRHRDDRRVRRGERGLAAMADAGSAGRPRRRRARVPPADRVPGPGRGRVAGAGRRSCSSPAWSPTSASWRRPGPST